MRLSSLVVLSFAVACATETPSAPAGGDAPAVVAPEPVAVAPEGAVLDPRVEVGRLPDGAWHCDMGGWSHYAGMSAGDGKCGACGMNLVQKEASPGP